MDTRTRTMHGGRSSSTTATALTLRRRSPSICAVKLSWPPSRASDVGITRSEGSFASPTRQRHRRKPIDRELGQHHAAQVVGYVFRVAADVRFAVPGEKFNGPDHAQA